MNYNLLSIRSSKLTNLQIKNICYLKDKQWKHGKKNQFKWFKKNIKSKDIHNMVYIRSKLIGYTALRNKIFKFKNSKIKKRYLLFDTLIIRKKYRGKKISKILMDFNNSVIKKSKNFSLLICNNKLISFYKKNGWSHIKKKNIKIMDRKSNKNIMIFNKKLSSKKNYYFHFE